MSVPRDPLLHSKLGEVSVGALCSRPCEWLAEDDHVETALLKLSKLRVYSLPLVNAKLEQRGFVDMLDIVTFVMDNVSMALSSKGIESLELDSTFRETRCKDVSNLSGRDPYIPVVEATSGFVALKALNDLGSLHRMPVINANGDLVGLLAQLDVNHFLASFIDQLTFANDPIEKFNLGFMFGLKSVSSIKKSAQVKQAFKIMKTKKLNGLAVVEESGILAGNISASDLKQIGEAGEMFKVVEYPIEKFLEKIGQTKPISIRGQTTIKEICKLFDQHKIHRVYIVDQDLRPAGVITLTNFLSFIASAAS